MSGRYIPGRFVSGRYIPGRFVHKKMIAAVVLLEVLMMHSFFIISIPLLWKVTDSISVRDGHGGGGSRKINAWHMYTLMVYL